MLAANVAREQVRGWIDISINGHSAGLELVWAEAPDVPALYTSVLLIL